MNTDEHGLAPPQRKGEEMLKENPCQVAKDFRPSSTDLCLSVFIGGFILWSLAATGNVD
jgi:hypothetical protein